DEAFWSDLGEGVLEEAVRELVVDDRLRVRGGRAFHAGRGAPASEVGLRTGSSVEYSIVDGDNRLVGTVDESRAYSLVHPGALYLHQGQQYRVTELDLDDRAAVVTTTDADEYTQPRTDTTIRILAEDEATDIGRARLFLGAVEVTEQVVAFQRKH